MYLVNVDEAAHCSAGPDDKILFKGNANMNYLVCRSVYSHHVRILYHTDCT